MKFILNLFNIIFCLLAINTLYSQNESSKKPIEIGVNLIKQNTFYHSGVVDVELNSSNFAYGLSLSIPISNFLNFHTGLQLSNQGQNFLIETSNNSTGTEPIYSDIEMELQYIKVPLQFKLGGNKLNNKRLTLNFILGPQLSFLKKATSTVDEAESNYSKSMNNLTIDIAGGIEVDVKIIKNIYFNLGYRFDYSITSAEPKTSLHYYYNSPGVAAQSGTKKITTHNRTSGCLFGLSVIF
tara:strand:+ start:62 stop:778 length:717 start_codon:yes stop_codon:yes gene_type:complete